MEMGEQYGLPDLRQLMGGRTLFPAIPQAAERYPSNGDLTTGQHYEMMMGARQVGEAAMLPLAMVDFRPDHSTSTSAADAAASASAICGLEKEACVGGDGGNGRWPRQETLTLLEIRSRLDPKFKEANQKGPLWDEVSRIMAEEHGYQRSGKKCREKFENLYKYYKKTKESRAGRQDGKHYRFFRQLEALYGERETTSITPVSALEIQTHLAATHSFRFQPTSNGSSPQANQVVQGTSQSQQKHCESLSLSNSSDFDTSSSEENENAVPFMEEEDWAEKKKMKMQGNKSHKRGRKSWKLKIRDFVDSQMRKLVETQEAWLEKMLKTLETKEQERMSREEAWRKEETTRLTREYKIWAHERAWIEARDAALMEALHKFTGREHKDSSPEELVATHDNSENQNENRSETLNDNTINNNCSGWEEHEMSSMIKLRTDMELRFHEGSCSEALLWEEISSKMACLGYNRSAKSCKDKWESISICNRCRSSKECCKRRKENSRTNKAAIHNHLHGLPYRQGTHEEQGAETARCHLQLQTSGDPSPSNSNTRTAVHDSCFRYLMAEEEPLWENYDVKLHKGENP